MNIIQQQPQVRDTLLLFGASGHCGKEILKQALESGLNVKCFEKDPANVVVPPGFEKFVTIIHGDIKRLDLAKEAVTPDVRYIVVAVGITGLQTMISYPKDIMLNLVTALVDAAKFKQNNVKRLIYTAGSFSPTPGDPIPLTLKIRRNIYGFMWGWQGMLKDNDHVIEYLTDQPIEQIDYIVSRPPMIIDSAKLKEKEKKEVKVVKKAPALSEPITYSGLATWTINSLLSKEEITERFPLLGYD